MIRRSLGIGILTLTTILGGLIIFIFSGQKSSMYTPVDVNVPESFIVCPLTFSNDDFSVTLRYPCQWTSCHAEPGTVHGQEWEGSAFLSIQAKSECALGFGKTGPEGSSSAVDTDASYYFDTDRSFEDWLTIRKKDIEGQNISGGKRLEFERIDTRNDSPETAAFKATDNENNWDSNTVYSLYKIYQHRAPYMFELAIQVPSSKESGMQSVIDRIIQSFTSESKKNDPSNSRL